ncbi:MAG TPA: hypothetical protein VLE93_01475 [Candidatus Saccharimonadales bacterium]|nr:hypothetical protein [Candidatus Saccharimonadales bacterium]
MSAPLVDEVNYLQWFCDCLDRAATGCRKSLREAHDVADYLTGSSLEFAAELFYQRFGRLLFDPPPSLFELNHLVLTRR